MWTASDNWEFSVRSCHKLMYNVGEIEAIGIFGKTYGQEKFMREAICVMENCFQCPSLEGSYLEPAAFSGERL